MSTFAARALGAALAVATVGVGAGAVLLGRVVRAEQRSMRPLVLKPGHRPAIIVFGGETRVTGPTKEVIARLRHALELFEQGIAPVIVVSGGVVVDAEGRTLDEAADMSAWLINQGVPPEAVMLGLPGGNTRQTVATMARLTRETGMRPWVAVSTPYHARRILDESRRVGIDVMVSGPADSPETRTPKVRRVRVLTEALATAYYLLPPAVTARVRTSAGTWRHSIPNRISGAKG